MARIRTIKPDFAQSESMGNVSRDARLLFILLWTVVDDSGRTRADSRMLARSLYPYDDGEEGAQKTSRADIEGWLAELEREDCVVRYTVEGNTFLQIRNWLNHRKIDKPTPSKLPEFDEGSRKVARIPDSPALDRKGKEGIGREEEGRGERARNDDSRKTQRATRLPADWQPTPDELRWAVDARPDVEVTLEVESFRDYWTAKAGKDATKADWPATFRNWIRRANARHGVVGKGPNRQAELEARN